jgi:uncharacterized membrane protein
MNLTEIWKRISNWKSLFGIASALLVISNALNLPINNEIANSIIVAVLSILVILGIINKEGMETTKWNK